MYFYNFGKVKDDEAFIEKEVNLKKLCDEKKKVVEVYENNIKNGNGAIDAHYFISYIELMHIEVEYAKLYLSRITTAKEEAMSCAGSHGITHTFDANQLRERAENVYDAYCAYCDSLEENKTALLTEVSKYIKGGFNEEDKFIAHSTLLQTYPKHQELCEDTKDYLEEDVRKFMLSCEQFIEDVQLLDMVDEDSDDDEPEV